MRSSKSAIRSPVPESGPSDLPHSPRGNSLEMPLPIRPNVRPQDKLCPNHDLQTDRMFVNYMKRALTSTCAAVAKMQLSASPSAPALPIINGNWPCPNRVRQSSGRHAAQGIGKDGHCAAPFDRKLFRCRIGDDAAHDGGSPASDTPLKVPELHISESSPEILRSLFPFGER